MSPTIRVNVPWHQRGAAPTARDGAPSSSTVQTKCILLVELAAAENSQETTWQCPHCKNLVNTIVKKEEVDS